MNYQTQFDHCCRYTCHKFCDLLLLTELTKTYTISRCTCCCCLPCSHYSNWSWVVERHFCNRLRSTLHLGIGSIKISPCLIRIGPENVHKIFSFFVFGCSCSCQKVQSNITGTVKVCILKEIIVKVQWNGSERAGSLEYTYKSHWQGLFE